MSGAEGEEIHDFQGAVAPGLGKPHATPNRGVISLGIGSAGVEHDEGDRRSRLLPPPPQTIAVLPRWVKLCPPLDGEHGERRAIAANGHKSGSDIVLKL